MSKNNILNLALLVLVIILGLFIYLSDFSEVENTELARLTDIKPEQIKQIEIHHKENTTLITRENDIQWIIKQPIEIAANSFRLESVLDLMNAPIHKHYAGSALDLATLGLNKPDTSIQFSTDEKNYLIRFGITNPATNLRYILMEGQVYTIEDVYFPLISSFFGTLVSLDLLPDDSTIDKLVLKNQTITKDDQLRWQSSLDFSGDAIAKIIEDWKGAQAFGIHEYLERDDLGEIEIYIDQQKQPIRFIISDNDPWLILARPELGIEYHLEVESYHKLVAP